MLKKFSPYAFLVLMLIVLATPIAAQDEPVPMTHQEADEALFPILEVGYVQLEPISGSNQITDEQSLEWSLTFSEDGLSADFFAELVNGDNRTTTADTTLHFPSQIMGYHEHPNTDVIVYITALDGVYSGELNADGATVAQLSENEGWVIFEAIGDNCYAGMTLGEFPVPGGYFADASDQEANHSNCSTVQLNGEAQKMIATADIFMTIALGQPVQEAGD